MGLKMRILIAVLLFLSTCTHPTKSKDKNESGKLATALDRAKLFETRFFATRDILNQREVKLDDAQFKVLASVICDSLESPKKERLHAEAAISLGTLTCSYHLAENSEYSKCYDNGAQFLKNWLIDIREGKKAEHWAASSLLRSLVSCHPQSARYLHPLTALFIEGFDAFPERQKEVGIAVMITICKANRLTIEDRQGIRKLIATSDVIDSDELRKCVLK